MPVSKLVTPLTRHTLSADVYHQLKELMMNGQMMPGEQLSLRGIATALGVSVMPVRDAVNRLAAEQALELTPNRAMRVPVMSVSQFREVTAIRVNLEGLATEQAARNLIPAQLGKVLELHDRFAQEMSRSKPVGARLITANKELHFAIYAGAGMPMLLQLIQGLWLRIGPILNYDLRGDSRRVRERVPVDHHSRLVDALKKRNGAAARAALQGDIESAAEYIVSAGVLVSADAGIPSAADNAAPQNSTDAKRPNRVRATQEA